MNYRHAYHAGNFCDVIKHITLTALITTLTHKDKPLFYLDTHAGIGYYDLSSTPSTKTQEYRDGIEKIIKADDAPHLVKKYVTCVQQLNQELSSTQDNTWRYYPGSPLFAKYLLRPQDRIALCELHPEDYRTLKTIFARDKQIAVHHLDGFLGLKAFLPPPEHRGLILIDPPYENSAEWMHIIKALTPALKRFAAGVYAIWYPIKSKKQLTPFYQRIKENIQAPVLIMEMTIHPDLPDHLNGCGMLIINPPWQLKETLNGLLPWLWKTLTINEQGGFSTFLSK